MWRGCNIWCWDQRSLLRCRRSPLLNISKSLKLARRGSLRGCTTTPWYSDRFLHCKTQPWDLQKRSATKLISSRWLMNRRTSEIGPKRGYRESLHSKGRHYSRGWLTEGNDDHLQELRLSGAHSKKLLITTDLWMKIAKDSSWALPIQNRSINQGRGPFRMRNLPRFQWSNRFSRRIASTRIWITLTYCSHLSKKETVELSGRSTYFKA